MELMEKLDRYIEIEYNCALRMPAYIETFKSHVFGAIEMVMLLDPEKEEILEKKWYDFEKRVDSAPVMWYNKDVERS
jgi:uncharacterized protein YnzC (UPF0291/DUF896 family)